MLTKDDLLDLGYEINTDPDQPGKFYWRQDMAASDISYDSEAETVAAATADAKETYELHRCDNCGKVHSDITLVEAKDLSMRTEPGGVIPSGECSDCGALCYPIVFEESNHEDGSMSDQEYVEKGGCTCPFCGSDDIEGGPFNADAGYATQEVSCNECDRSWEDQYKLTGYIAD